MTAPTHPTTARWVSILLPLGVIDRAERVGDLCRIASRDQTLEIPWTMVQRWRPRASYRDFGTAPWRDA
jgi:hypothetical protein